MEKDTKLVWLCSEPGTKASRGLEMFEKPSRFTFIPEKANIKSTLQLDFYGHLCLAKLMVILKGVVYKEAYSFEVTVWEDPPEEEEERSC